MAGGPDQLAEAERWIEEVEDVPWASSLAELARACIARRRRQPVAALAGFARARGLAERAGLAHVAAAARWRHGEVLAGDGGRADLDAARVELQALGMLAPARVVDLLAP